MNSRMRKLLREVRARLDKGWCQRSLARDSAGHAVDLSSKRAVSFCMIGAIWSTTASLSERDALCERLRSSLPKKTRATSVSQFNDMSTTTKRKVLNVVDRALESK